LVVTARHYARTPRNAALTRRTTGAPYRRTTRLAEHCGWVTAWATVLVDMPSPADQNLTLTPTVV
jgi:hypothetical protein